MADEASQENQQFEQVLHRLDALMKRNQASADASDIMSGPPTFVILPPPDETWSDATAPEPIEEKADEIPLLTEVYHGALPAAPQATTADSTIDAGMEQLLPPLLAALDSAIEEETARMRTTLAARLEQQLADMLRQQRKLDESAS